MHHSHGTIAAACVCLALLAAVRPACGQAHPFPWFATSTSYAMDADTTLQITLGAKDAEEQKIPGNVGVAVVVGGTEGTQSFTKQLDFSKLAWGDRVVDEDMRIQFAPATGASGTFEVVFRVEERFPSATNGSAASSDQGYITIVVTAPNVPPTAREVEATGIEDQPVVVGLEGNDPDAEAGTSLAGFRITRMLQNNAGTLHYFDAGAASNVGPAISGENALVLDTKVVFVPNPNYYFAKTPIFAYKAIDARGGESDEAAASIQIDINKFDDAPTTVVPGDTPKMGTANTANIVLQAFTVDVRQLAFQVGDLTENPLATFFGRQLGVCEDTACEITNKTTTLVNDVGGCFTFQQASGSIPTYSIQAMQCAATLTAVATGQGAGLTPDAIASIVYRAVDVESGLQSAWAQMPLEVDCSDSDDSLVSNTWSTGDVCIECPFGGFCADGVSTPIAASGFWLVPDTNTTFLVCTPTEACPGGSGSKCTVGYTDRLCGSCAVGYYRSGGRCIQCPTASVVTTVGIIFLLIVGLLVVVILAWKFAKAKGSKAWASIGINFFQVVVVLTEFNLDWPSEVKDVSDWISLFNFNLEIAAPECEIPNMDYTSKLKIYLVAPIICLATLLVVAVVASCWEWFRAKKASREAQNAGQPPVVAVAKNASPSAVPPSPTFAAMSELKGTSQDARRAPPAGALHALASAKKTAGQLKRAGSIRSLWKSSSSTERCIVAGLTLMKLYYLAVSAQVFGFFDCTTQADGSSTLDPDPSLICGDTWWLEWRWIMGLSVLIYVLGIPFAFCIVLGVSPGAALIHVLMQAHDSLYTIAELFEVALVGETPDPMDEKPRGSELEERTKVVRRHGKCMTFVLLVLLIPYFAWGALIVEPCLFIYGFVVVLVARPLNCCCRCFGLSGIVPRSDHTRHAVDVAEHAPAEGMCKLCCFRRAALSRVGRRGVWLPIPGMPGDPALDADGTAGTAAASYPATDDDPDAGPNTARTDSPVHELTAADVPTAVPDTRFGQAGSQRAAQSPTKGVHQNQYTNSFRAARGVLPGQGSFAARSMANIDSAPELAVNTSSRLDGKLPFVAQCLSRDYRREVYYFELFILGRKLLLLFPKIFISNYPALQATVTVVVLLIALCLQLHYRPYRSDALNWLEFTGLLIACWVLLAGLLFNAGQFPRASMRTALAKLVIVAIVSAIVYMCFALLWAALTELSRHLRNLDDVNLPKKQKPPRRGDDGNSSAFVRRPPSQNLPRPGSELNVIELGSSQPAPSAPPPATAAAGPAAARGGGGNAGPAQRNFLDSDSDSDAAEPLPPPRRSGSSGGAVSAVVVGEGEGGIQAALARDHAAADGTRADLRPRRSSSSDGIDYRTSDELGAANRPSSVVRIQQQHGDELA